MRHIIEFLKFQFADCPQNNINLNFFLTLVNRILLNTIFNSIPIECFIKMKIK